MLQYQCVEQLDARSKQVSMKQCWKYWI